MNIFDIKLRLKKIDGNSLLRVGKRYRIVQILPVEWHWYVGDVITYYDKGDGIHSTSDEPILYKDGQGWIRHKDMQKFDIILEEV